MKIIFLGSFVESSQYQTLFNSRTSITVSGSTFQNALLKGFDRESSKGISIINAPDIGSYPIRSSKLFIRSNEFILNDIKGTNCGFVNLMFFKRYFIYASLFNSLKKICSKYKQESIIIICYSLVYPYIKAALDIKKSYHNVKVIPIVLDLPEFFGESKSKLSTIIPDYVSKTKRLYPEFDGTIVLTMQMIDKLEASIKPNLLMEGIYDPTNALGMQYEKRPKSILYTGKLDSRFGIDVLLKAFNKINDPEFELWIYGDGTARGLVKEFANKDARIKYFGLRPQTEIFIAQQRASLLVNPRQNIEEYTKYSFPSKTMEYLGSGTPTIMYKLDGIPDEYDEFLIYPKSNDIQDLSTVLEKWGSKSINELNKFGEKGKQFILNNKSSKIQAHRLIEFLKTNYE